MKKPRKYSCLGHHQLDFSGRCKDCKKPVPPEILDWRDEFLKEDRRCHWFGPWLVIVFFFVAILVLICILYKVSYIPPISMS